jgi:hypothetical protein
VAGSWGTLEEMGGVRKTNNVKSNTFITLMRKSKGKRPLEKPNLGLTNNITVDNSGMIEWNGYFAPDWDVWTPLTNTVTVP